MTVSACRTAAILSALSANLILVSCSGESGPQPGTPAFFWSAAKQTFAAGDYVKTLDHLDKIVASENEYTARARPWLLVLTSGMARGFGELADRFEAGARANKSDPGSFRKNMNMYRSQASRLSLHFAEVFSAFQKSQDEAVPLAFSYPTGSANPPLVLTKVASGMSPASGDVETAQKQNVERGVLLAACAAAGAPDDPAKTQEVLKSPDAKVPRAVFITAMASALYDQSQLFSRRKMDDPEKMKILCSRAQDALKSIPESKESKDLSGKIEKTLKAAKS
jgi:hypothetical protein